MSELKSSHPRIVYIIPETGIFGGTHVVLQHANRLMDRGYDVSLVSLDNNEKIEWFSNKVPVIKLADRCGSSLGDIDILVATHWGTAIQAASIIAKRKIYFVQSDERRFNAGNKKHVRLCEATYRTNFEFITEAKWIQRWLKEEFNHDAYYVPNGLDLNTFYKTETQEPKSDKARVLLEGPIDSWFKGMKYAFEAVKDLGCEVWCVSNSGRPGPEWHCDRFFENIPIEEMKRIYSSCDVLLKMSLVEGFFGPPMEAMACGCAVVVGKCTGYDEYIIPGENALVVETGDVLGAKRAVQQLIDDKELRATLIANGFETASQWSWNRSIDFLEEVIRKEPVEKFYTDVYPEKYDYTKELEKLSALQRDLEPFSYWQAVRQKAKKVFHVRKLMAVLKNRFTYMKKVRVFLDESKEKR